MFVSDNKVINLIMFDQHQELFQELYTQKYIKQRPQQQNAIQRIQLLQKQIKEEKMFKRYHDHPVSTTEYFSNLQNLEVIHDDAPKRIVRALLTKRKKLPFRINQLFSEHIQSERPNTEQMSSTHINLRENGKTPHQRSFTHRVRQNGSLPIGQKKFSIQYKSWNKVKKLSRRQENSSAYTEKRSLTPSRNVMIGGRNLQKEAEGYRKQLRKFDQEIARYQQVTNQRILQNRKKSIRSQRHMRQQKIREGLRDKGIRKSRSNAKDENVELQPWSVMAETQFY